MALSLTDPAGNELAARDPGAGAWLYKILTRQRGHTHAVVTVPRPGNHRIRAELLATEGSRPDRQVVLTFAPLRSPGRFLWLLLGLGGQICFSLRFLLQWLASEKAGRSTIPRAFWYCSLFGGIAILIYAIYTRDPVFILAYAFNTFIYVRNLALIGREDRGRPEPPAAPVRQSAGRASRGRE
ncbi:MAG: lipid-A-disaccharide synthase N-terminal domain-containing protein [Planctomycetes bacterium]|nr:lipid-A-disaccharide synthase N-terminal domain-containing protein [Planctomycetota bacterium]